MPFSWPIPQINNSQTPYEPKPMKKNFIPQAPNPFVALLSNTVAARVKIQLESAVQNLGKKAMGAVYSGVCNLSYPANGKLFFARIFPTRGGAISRAMTADAIEERLAGVPVYALSNAEEEFVLISGMKTGRSLGLFCFKREDAEALLDQMKSMNQEMRDGSKVVAVALNKVFRLRVDGVAFRLIPDPEQVLKATKLKDMAGEPVDFPGVPVFQSRSLALRSQGKRYRPAFFRKEDLEDSLLKASSDQRQLNPSLRKGDIEVSVLEEIISAMKGSSTSDWDDIVFIPPGFKVATSIRDERPITVS